MLSKGHGVRLCQGLVAPAEYVLGHGAALRLGAAEQGGDVARQVVVELDLQDLHVASESGRTKIPRGDSRSPIRARGRRFHCTTMTAKHSPMPVFPDRIRINGSPGNFQSERHP